MCERIQTFIWKLSHQKLCWIMGCDVLTICSLTLIFYYSFKDTLLAYGMYVFSAFSLLITIVYLYELTANSRKRILRSHFIHQYHVDIQWQMKVKLYSSIIINVLYAVFKLIIGIIYQSIWDLHIGIYYLVICMVRMMLLRQVYAYNLEMSKAKEYIIYKRCGWCLIILNIILTGEVILMVWRNYTYDYPGYIIYIAAMYAFYITFSSIRNGIKDRKHGSLIINAMNIICFVSALVSMLSLQTAMFTQFDTQGVSFVQRANAITGFVVCLLVCMISMYMILHAKKGLKELMVAIIYEN